MVSDIVRRTARGLYLGQLIRVRSSLKVRHPAKIVYVHPSGLWITAEMQLANGNDHNECFYVQDLIEQGVIQPRTHL